MDSGSNNRILWLHGPAGGGKSAIAQTLSEMFGERRHLAAGFFFSRGKERQSMAKYFVTTIAYQLSKSIPRIGEAIGSVIARDPSILYQTTAIQLQKIIVEPFKYMFQMERVLPSRRQAFIIILDGLDECEGDDDQCYILNHISTLINKDCLPLTFIISSRPEPHIYHQFEHDPFLSTSSTRLPLEPSNDDIRIFLDMGFRHIRRSHEIMKHMADAEWPTEVNLQKLLQRSSGYFIYPSTVLQFVGNRDTHPIVQLNLVLSGEPHPFKDMDRLYHQILSSVSNHTLLVRMLGYIFVSNQQLSISMIDSLLGIQTGLTRLTLRRMRPLLEFSGDHDNVRVIHVSFEDFITDRRRSKSFYIDKGEARSHCSRKGLKFLKGWKLAFPTLAYEYTSHISAVLDVELRHPHQVNYLFICGQVADSREVTPRPLCNTGCLSS